MNAEQHQQVVQHQQQQDLFGVRCRYPSKRCENQRVIKRNGELHRFCDYHRVIANHNQQRLQQRRRLQQRCKQNPQEDVPLAVDMYMQQQYAGLLPQHQAHGANLELPIDLDEEDLRVLEALLFEEECESRDQDLPPNRFFSEMLF